MDSFSVITDTLFWKENFLKSCKEDGATIDVFDDKTDAQKISFSTILDQFNKPQYVILYTYEMESKIVDQFEEAEKSMILNMGFQKIYKCSFEFNSIKVVELLTYLIDQIILIIQTNNKNRQILLSEDVNGKIYSFDEFYLNWIKNKLFWRQ